MRGSDDDSTAGRILSMLGLGAILAGIVLAHLTCSGCSGASLPVVTVPITVHCSWSVTGGTSGGESSEVEREDGTQDRRASGVAIIDSDCIVEDVSPSTSPSTTGQSTTTGDITPSVEVSATGSP